MNKNAWKRLLRGAERVVNLVWKTAKSQGILKWKLSGNPGKVVLECFISKGNIPGL